MSENVTPANFSEHPKNEVAIAYMPNHVGRELVAVAPTRTDVTGPVKQIDDIRKELESEGFKRMPGQEGNLVTMARMANGHPYDAESLAKRNNAVYAPATKQTEFRAL